MIEEVLKAKVVSMLGKAVAGNLIKLIPGAGTIVGAVVNAGVASGITYAMGRGLVKAAEMICEHGWQNSLDMITYAIRVSI